MLQRTVASRDDSLVVSALWRAIEVFRPLALVYAAWSAWTRAGQMQRPGAAVAVFVVLAAWTAAQGVWGRRQLAWQLTELGLAAAAVIATRWVDSPDAAILGMTTLPSVWQAVPVASLAVLRGWRGGTLAGAVIAVAMVVATQAVALAAVSNGLLVMLLGGVVGVCADRAREEQEELRQALEREAEDAERDRLARTVHDGVLQALAFIHRRGVDAGGEAARLGEMAGEQEQRLRELVSGVPIDELEATVGGPVDLRQNLHQAAAGTADLIAPAEPVLLPRRPAAEMVAAVEAALDNVRRHAGPDAHAWVLIDDAGEDIVVTVRDNGVGVSEDRITEASERGRLGVSSSIRGRLEELGGSARYLYGPGGGTTVEMWIPKQSG
ncbi:MAG: DUF5931 domain-containing protein [Actinomycetota bacterium]|nr:DUF5931 domain-containing protein [Actinomycetota bacterium]